MDIDEAIRVLKAYLKNNKDWQIIALFPTKAVEAVVNHSEKHLDNLPTSNFYEK